MRFIKSKIRYKIMFFLLILIMTSSFITMLITAKQVEKSNVVSTTKYLAMLNESIFQTLRNAMNTGDPVLMHASVEDARKIKGVKHLNVAKSKPLIELYSPTDTFTKDSDVLKVFNTKKVDVIEYTTPAHDIRMLKPVLATPECMMCHANQQVGDVIGVMDLTFSLEESDSQLFEIMKNLFIISAILGAITLVIIFFLLKKTTQPIQKLQNAIKNLKVQKNTKNTISITSSDEIGEVAKDFNEYIQSINKVQEEDKIVIKEAKLVIDRVKNGCYLQTISAKTSNTILDEFKNSVNDMILATKKHFETMNSVLEKYANYDYTYELKIIGIEKDGVFQTVIDNIVILRNSIIKMLLENKSNGLSLSNSSNILLENVNILNDNSTKSATALELTSAAVEQITRNIANNNQNIIQMSQIASNVTNSAIEGKKLASQTTLAMNEIDQEVNAIHEAIEVIDQITLQTNILSLNAAVEAATAGESGKGFAVVAQEVRTLAHKSAEAANKIKILINNATSKTDDGKIIADDMTNGYSTLTQNIEKTIQLINDVEIASKEQLIGIEQINDTINNLDKQTQQNSSVATKTNEVATTTNSLAKLIVKEVNSKRF